MAILHGLGFRGLWSLRAATGRDIPGSCPSTACKTEHKEGARRNKKEGEGRKGAGNPLPTPVWQVTRGN